MIILQSACNRTNVETLYVVSFCFVFSFGSNSSPLGTYYDERMYEVLLLSPIRLLCRLNETKTAWVSTISFACSAELPLPRAVIVIAVGEGQPFLENTKKKTKLHRDEQHDG